MQVIDQYRVRKSLKFRLVWLTALSTPECATGSDRTMKLKRRSSRSRMAKAALIASVAANQTAAVVELVRALLAEQRTQIQSSDGPGRGYSWYPRRARRRKPLVMNEARLRCDVDEYEDWFTLRPSEFDELFQWMSGPLDTLSPRRLPTRERLALTLHHLRTCAPGKRIARAWGIGKSTALKDIHDIMLLLMENTHLEAEVSWPSQSERDAEVRRVADRYPTLAGAFVAVDGTKRAAAQCGRTFDRSLHKHDYDKHKHHGRHILVVCMLSTGRIVWLDCNAGNRNESNQWREYELSLQERDTYWSETVLPANNAGRERDYVVQQTAIADSAYKCPVNALAGAPAFLIPRADLSHLEEVRCVVEQAIGRVGNSWRAASDKAGAWHMVGNGGIQGTGSMQGMAMSQVYFIVAARLTTMMQSRRKTWTRDPESFEYTDPNSIKLAVALGQL